MWGNSWQAFPPYFKECGGCEIILDKPYLHILRRVVDLRLSLTNLTSIFWGGWWMWGSSWQTSPPYFEECGGCEVILDKPYLHIMRSVVDARSSMTNLTSIFWGVWWMWGNPCQSFHHILRRVVNMMPSLTNLSSVFWGGWWIWGHPWQTFPPIMRCVVDLRSSLTNPSSIVWGVWWIWDHPRQTIPRYFWGVCWIWGNSWQALPPYFEEYGGCEIIPWKGFFFFFFFGWVFIPWLEHRGFPCWWDFTFMMSSHSVSSCILIWGMVRAGCVSVTGIHPSWTWKLGSL